MEIWPPSLHGVDVVDIGRTWCRVTTEASDEPGHDYQLARANLDAERVVVVVGAPGVGKTVELYRWYQDTASSSWLNLSQMTDANTLARELAERADEDTGCSSTVATSLTGTPPRRSSVRPGVTRQRSPA